MKVSLSWAQYYSNVDLLKGSTVDQLVAKIGAQLGAVEETVDLGKKFQGIVVAKVVKCEMHPNADKLSLCLIDDSGKAQNVERNDAGYVQVVCGAPNVREGLLVAWLPPGATVPSSVDKDPFVLEARELRGKVSNGMLASASELAISDDHSGILELSPDDAEPGDDFADAYKLNDSIIDIENKMFTHRPDLFGQLGVAREIAGITHQKFTSPEWYVERPSFTDGNGTGDMVVEVKNELPELTPRFMAAPMNIASNGPSPIWLQTYLSRVGLRPINTVVDITNYLMTLTAQPLHAYDYDKLLALEASDRAVITVRKPQEGEKLRLLNGKEIQPRSEAIMIAGNERLLGMAGVMGGGDTEVDEHTRRIVIEVATFDMYSIRRTAMEHGLFTDAVTRFNKGQSPLQNDRVMAKAIEMVQELAGGHVAGVVQDDDHSDKQERTVTAGVPFINERLGLNLSAGDMKTLLENVEFQVSINKDVLRVIVPFWRMDIEIPEDIVEEVGRLYGFDQLPLNLPVRNLTPAPQNSLLNTKSRIRNILSTAGANEVLTYSFVHGDMLEKSGQDKEEAFRLSNALSPDLQYYRLSLTPSLLANVHGNIKSGYDEFALFEIGKSHNKSHHENNKTEVPEEFEMVSLVYTAKDEKVRKSEGAAFYQVRVLLDYLAKGLGLEFDYRQITDAPDYAVTRPYDLKRSAYVVEKTTGAFLGIIGEITFQARRNFKLPIATAAFEVGTQHLLDAIEKNKSPRYKALPKFPRVEQDISLKVPNNLSYQELYEFVQKEIHKVQPANIYSRITPIDIYQRQDDPSHRQIALRYTVASYEKTMTAEEVNNILDQAASSASKKFGAVRL